jgi:ketosteroid isomerase-like protein
MLRRVSSSGATEVTVSNPDLSEFISRYHAALDEFFRGNPKAAKALYSHQDDASLGNPFGPFVMGWPEVEATMERAASNYRDGRATGFDTLATHVTPDLAYLVEVERFEAKIGAEQVIASGALRVTTVLRPEDGEWMIVHRHADPITAPRSADSAILISPTPST